MRTLSEEEAIQALNFMEKLVVGLGRLGSRFHDDNEELAWALLYSITPEVVGEAAKLRRMLYGKYNQELQDGEDLDEVEKLLSDLFYWKTPTHEQLAQFRANRLQQQADTNL